MSPQIQFKRSLSSLAVKVTVGAVVATPLVAICQASYFLLNYRLNHADNPRPVCPARGALLVRKEEAPTQQIDASELQSEPPLRLLVIGDSLAMGIGCSTSVPVLPVTIAKCLSKAFGGRIVDWTCHGKAGLSAAQLAKEIEVFQNGVVSDWNKEAQPVVNVSKKPLSFSRENNSNTHSSAVAGDWKKWCNLLHTCRDPRKFGQYDVVVVIIGMGDLKGAVLPFLTVETKENHGNQQSKGFKHDLASIRNLFMKREDDTEKNDEKHPLVVFPALPAKPVRIFQYPPLSWFVVPLVEVLDAEKQELAESLPANVVFTREPSNEEIEEFEEQRGSIYTMFDQDEGTFQLFSNQNVLTKSPDAESRQCKDVGAKAPTSARFSSLGFRKPLGSTLCALDKIHPNNTGYDFWGRQIGGEILRQWDKSIR